MNGSSTSSSSALRAWERKRIGDQRRAGDQDKDRGDEHDDAVAAVEEARLAELVVEVGAVAGGLGGRVGGRERDDRRGEQSGTEEAEGEERRGDAAGQRFQGPGGIAGAVDRYPFDVQGRRAGDDDEEADHAGQHGAVDHVDALVAQILDLQLLVDPRRTG